MIITEGIPCLCDNLIVFLWRCGMTHQMWIWLPVNRALHLEMFPDPQRSHCFVFPISLRPFTIPQVLRSKEQEDKEEDEEEAAEVEEKDVPKVTLLCSRRAGMS